MKITLSILILTIMSLSIVSAQQDTVYVTTDSTGNQGFNRDKKYRYIDQSLLKRKTLYKLGLHINSIDNKDRLSVEHKIWPSLSMELGFQFPQSEQAGVFGQLRYYPSKRAGAPESVKKIDNFNGNYFSFEANKGFEIDLNENSANLTAREESTSGVYSIGFGRQQKVGNWGFLDLSANLRYAQALDQLSVGLKFMTGVAYGRSFADDRYVTNKYQEFKTNYGKEVQLFKLLNPVLNISRDFVGAGISFGYERMLFQNISVNSTLSLSANHSEFPREFSAYVGSLSSELRYYYNFNRRLRKGHNPRMFSGYYVGLGVNDLLVHRRTTLDIGDSFSRNRLSFNDLNGFDVAVIQANWGMQQRIGKRGFFDLGIGILYRTYDQSVGYAFRSSLGVTLGK